MTDPRPRHDCIPPGGAVTDAERKPASLIVEAVCLALRRAYSIGTNYDLLEERANNIVQALCLGNLTIAESERAVWDALGVDNGAGVVPESQRRPAVRAILTAWINVRPEPAAEPKPQPDLARAALVAALAVMVDLQRFDPRIGHLPSVRAALCQVCDALGEEVPR